MSEPPPRRKRTSTSGFGAPGRVSHDAGRFYASRLYAGVEPAAASIPENPLPPECANRLFCQSSEHMPDLPDACVHRMVTSPPYNASKEYDQDLDLPAYLALLNRVWAETYPVLAPGGRACINVANLGRKPYLPLHSFIIQQMLEIGFRMRGEIIWDKAASSSPSTAWGSWRSPANPVDATAYFRMLGENQAHLHEFLPANLAAAQNEDDVRKVIHWQIRQWQRGELFILGLWEQSGGEYVGEVYLANADWEVPCIEVGYFTVQHQGGKGYAVEAARAACRIAFERLGVRRVELQCAADNEKSAKLARHCGFILEGRLRQRSHKKDGSSVDRLWFGLLRSEWQLKDFINRTSDN